MYTITIYTKFNRGIVHNHHFTAQIEALGVMSQCTVQIRSLTIIIFWVGGGTSAVKITLVMLYYFGEKAQFVDKAPINMKFMATFDREARAHGSPF